MSIQFRERQPATPAIRELLAIALLMPVIIAVVPDRIAADHADRSVPSGASGTMPEKTTTIA